MSAIEIYPLPYENHLIHRYECFVDLPGFVLLESQDHQYGRYDILTALPYDTLTISRQNFHPQEAFEQLQSKLLSVPSTNPLPFQGGAIGYVSYDLGAMLAGIDSIPHPMNDMPLLDMKFYDWAIIVDHHYREAQLLVANQQLDTKWMIEDVLKRWKKNLVPREEFTLYQALTPLIHEEEYRSSFEAIHQALMQGRAYQVNYTQPFIGKYHGSSWAMYKKIRAQNRVPYGAFIPNQEGHILSFSPERFLCIENHQVLTSPIKGTMRRSSDLQKDELIKKQLLNSDKNRAENVMIVDLLRNDLGQFSKPGSVIVTDLFELQSFKSVHHLVSTIESKCQDDVTLTDAFAACFPGGSISGAPKRESMLIIQEQEPFARGIYCGSIAYFSNHGRLDSNIAIRTIVAKDEMIYLCAGGGIVIDSQWKDEYRECLTKIDAIVSAF